MKRLFILLAWLAVIVPAAAQDTKLLDETFVTEDERLTLRYPSGWVVESSIDGQVLVATDESLFRINSAIPTGGGALGIIIFEDEEMNELIFVGEDIVEKLTYLIDTLLADSPDYDLLSGAEGLTLNDREAAFATGRLSENEVFILLVDYGDDRLLFMVGLTAPDDMARFQPKLLAIAESVNYG